MGVNAYPIIAIQLFIHKNDIMLEATKPSKSRNTGSFWEIATDGQRIPGTNG